MKFISVIQVAVLSAFVIISSKARIIKLQKCMAVYQPQYKKELNANTSTTCSSSATSYYYDDRIDECKIYPGCGNGNAEITFSSIQECEGICKTVCGEANENVQEFINEDCAPFSRGLVYDKNSNKCKVYMACAGERKVFYDKSRCEKLCVKLVVVKPTSGPTLRPTPRPTSRPTLRPIPIPTSYPGNFIDLQFSSRPTLRPTPRPISYPGNFIDIQFPSRPILRPTPRPTGFHFPNI